MADEWSCITGPVIATNDINQVPFKMYPNPNASGILSMEAEQPIQRVEFYNLLGQHVYTEQITHGQNYADVNLKVLETGMYMVKLVFTENRISIQKLIIE